MAERHVVERGEGGIDRAVVNGRRFELRGAEIAGAGPAEQELDGGARTPPWAAGFARYVFWKGKQLWGAESFLGPLRSLGTLPAEPRGSFDWLDGAAVVLPGGALVARPAGGAPGRTGGAGIIPGVAADARRALAVPAPRHA